MHHQAVTCRICRVVTAQGHAHCRVLAFLTLAVLFLPATAQTIPSAPPAGVWFADHHTLYRIDPVTNGSSASIELKDEVEGLAVDPRDGAVWALSHKRLGKFDRAGLSLLDIHLKDLESKLEEAGALVLNPYQGDVWIAGKQQLLYLNQAGAKRLTWSAPDKIKAIALDLDETVWVLTKRGLRHVAEDGRTLSTLDLKPHLQEPKGLVVDGLGGLLWIIGEKALLRFDAHRLDQPPLRIPWSENQGEIETETAASHPIFGTVWLVAKDALLLYNRSGTLIKQVDLKPHGLGEIEAMVFEPVSASLWLAGKKSVARFTGNGEYVARIELQELQKETEAIAAGPFTLAPSLTPIAPPDNTLTNNPAPRLEYELGARCNESPCMLVDSYINSFNLTIDLNGLAIGPLFSRSGARAFYSPMTRLPEGVNTLKAKATDVFGHASPEITSRFTIDTLAPKFVSISPLDGSAFTQAAVTISGSVDDPTASVMLYDASGSMLSMAGARFAFSVILKQDWNVFTLVARDAAGNPTSTPLRLYLNTLAATLTDPLPGSTVGTDSLVLSGTFKGPENTGITVNGIAAFTDGQNFYVNNLPLSLGANTLTITITGPDGQTSTQTVTVTSSGPSPLKVEVDPQVGLAPHTTRFTIGYSGTGTVTRYTLDVDGDGVVDDTGTDIALPREYTYTAPGIYRPRVTLTDSTGKAYDQTLVVLVQDPAQVDAFFTMLWSGMNTALTSGNVAQAAGYLNQSAKRKYTPVFEALKPKFPQIVASYSPLQRLSVSETIGEYAIQRAANGQNRVYLIYFLKDTDGVWRVDEM